MGSLIFKKQSRRLIDAPIGRHMSAKGECWVATAHFRLMRSVWAACCQEYRVWRVQPVPAGEAIFGRTF
jgi:hypothetical protein